MKRRLFATRAGAGTLALVALLTAPMITRVSAEEDAGLPDSATVVSASTPHGPLGLAFDSLRYWAAFDTLAKLNGVRAEDFRVDPAALELAGGYPDRLNLQRYLMAAPLRAPGTMENLARRITATSPDLFQPLASKCLGTLGRMLGRGPARISRNIELEATSDRITGPLTNYCDPFETDDAVRALDAAVELLFEGTGKRFQGRLREDVLRDTATLDPPVTASVARVVVAAAHAIDVRDRVLADSDLARGGFMGSRTRSTVRALSERLTTSRSSFDPNAERESQMAVWRKLASVDVRTLEMEAVDLANALERVAGDPPDWQGPPFQMEWSTPRGRVAVGGPGPNRYHGKYLFVLDLGGDDAYEGSGAAADGQPVSIVIDLGGKDRYAPEDSTSPGPGGAILGFAAVYDLGDADDEYTAGAFGIGFGLCGCGWVVDQGGNDRYSVQKWGEGAASYGIGLLIDAAGWDTYDADGAGRTCAEGFGGPQGAGALLDLGGGDLYRALAAVDTAPATDGPKRPCTDLAQGSAAGAWLGEAGGIGLLIDVGGNDKYTALLGAQGAGRNAGVGVLVDLAGNDRYSAVSHAEGQDQGIGVLVEAGGDDLYESSRPFTGGIASGWDLGVGSLADGSGDDEYSTDGPAASVNEGAAFLIDLDGVDEYSSGSAGTAAASMLVPLRALSRGVAVFIDLGVNESRLGSELIGVLPKRPRHGPSSFAPRLCLGGALMGGRVYPPIIQP